jgi:UDP-N-acetylmuramyl pentapeptide synthase
MRVANVVAGSATGYSRILHGQRLLVGGEAFLRFEPEFVFYNQSIQIRIGRDEALFLVEDLFVSRDTIAIFVAIPELEPGAYWLNILAGSVVLFRAELEVIRSVDELKSALLASACQSWYFRNRSRVQALPFSKMLSTTRAALDSYGCLLVYVTGSVGKTTTKELIAHCLRPFVSVVKSTDSWNFPHEICSQILNNIEWGKIFVMEAALGKHMHLMGECLPPDIFVFTEVGLAHSSFSANVADIARVKASLANSMRGGTVIFNDANEVIEREISRLESVCRGVVKRIPLSSIRRAFEGKALSDLPPGLIMSNALCAIGASLAALPSVGGMNYIEQIHTFPGVPCRLEKIECGRIAVVNDSYNSNPVSVRQFLKYFSDVKYAGARTAVVLGEMADLGISSLGAHGDIAREAMGVADMVFLLGACYDSVESESVNVIRASDLGGLYEVLMANISKADCIGIKGSNSTGLLGFAFRLIAELRGDSHTICAETAHLADSSSQMGIQA